MIRYTKPLELFKRVSRLYTTSTFKSCGTKESSDKKELPKPHHTDYSSVNFVQQTVESIGAVGAATYQYTHEFEQQFMKRINEINRQKFRTTLIFIIVTLLCIYGLIGEETVEKIRTYFTKQGTGIAKETLENETLKIQTQELATAVVQTILNDPEVTSQAATFLREAVMTPETQEALLRLTNHVLQHPESVAHLSDLTLQVVQFLSTNQASTEAISILLATAVKDPIFLTATTHLVKDILKDPIVMKSITKFLLQISTDEEIKQAVRELMLTTAGSILEDKQVMYKSREFVAEVLGDDTLQKEGGNALWNSINHALKPGVRSMVGAGLIIISIGLARIILSPF